MCIGKKFKDIPHFEERGVSWDDSEGTAAKFINTHMTRSDALNVQMYFIYVIIISFILDFQDFDLINQGYTEFVNLIKY